MLRSIFRFYKNALSIIIISLSLFSTITLRAQYMTPHGSSFQPFTYEELVRPLQEMQRAHNQAANTINDLYGYVVDILGHEIDGQLRQEMNAELKTLESISTQLSKNGISASINNAINESYRRIQKKIADYNNRVAQHNEQARRDEEARIQEAARKAKEPDDWSGTGFALKGGYIVTNFHVVDRSKTIMVYGIQGSMLTGYAASVVATDKVNDIAILKITDSRFSGFGTIPYAINNQMADVGEDVWVLGYPLTQVLGNEIKLTNGVISSKSGYQGDVATYQISAPIQPGNSGGPLFDSKGNIVGIINAGVPGTENVGYAIKTSYLRNLLDSYSLSSYLPTNNTISAMALKDKVKSVNNYVFLIICSTKTSSVSVTPSSKTTTSQSTSSASSGMSLSKTSLSLKIGESASLYAYNYGSSLSWESDNPSIATVSSNGVVKGISPGKTTIWAKGREYKMCMVTVRDDSASSSVKSSSSSRGSGQSSSGPTTSATNTAPKKQVDDSGITITNLANAKADGTQLRITKIRIQDSQTIIDFECGNAKPEGGYLEYIQIEKSAVIIVDGKTYQMTKVGGIKISPEKSYFSRPSETLSFKLYFPPINKSARLLDFVESPTSTWQIRNIKLQ